MLTRDKIIVANYWRMVQYMLATLIVMPPPLIGGGIKRCFCLMSVCLSVICLTSVAYIGPKWRTEKPRKTKIGTEVAHVTRDSDTTFKVKRSKIKVTKPVSSPRRLRTGSCSGQRGNVLSVGNCCYVAVCRRGGRLGSARRPLGEERGGGVSCRDAVHQPGRSVGRRMVVARSN